jgi:hypothetical protein
VGWSEELRRKIIFDRVMDGGEQAALQAGDFSTAYQEESTA